MKFLLPLLLLFTPFILSQGEDGCSSKLSDTNCISCKEGYYLTLQNDPSGVPKIICSKHTEPQNCAIPITENSNTICLHCNPRYFLQGNECKECPKNCATCNSTHCFSCDGSYSLSMDETECIDCSEENNEENNEKCGKCPTGKYFEKETKKCEICKDNCALCTSKDDCFKCKNNKVLKDNNCETIEGCTENGLKDDHCEECVEGYRLENGNCVKCSIQHCEKCYIKQIKVDVQGNEETVEKTLCSQCEENFVLNDGMCKKGTEINCKKGSPVYGCLECQDGFFYNSETLQCEECSDECETCINSKDKCLSCRKNYYYDPTTANPFHCTKMDEHCNLADQYGCIECNNVKALQNPNEIGYFVPPNGKECQQCDSNCKLCSEVNTHCTACVENKVLIGNEAIKDGENIVGWYYKCQDKPSECLKTEMGYCTSCADGFYLGSANFTEKGDIQECLKCHESCATCQDPETCLTCGELYFKSREDGSCLLISDYSDICVGLTHDSDGCDKCIDGYYIDGSQPLKVDCSECPLECKTCSYNYEIGNATCDICADEKKYVKNGKCADCSELPNCELCEGSKCKTCKKGYTLDTGGLSCSKIQLELIIPLVIVAVLIIIIVVVGIIFFLWRKRVKSIDSQTAAIKPFHVSSDLELILLGADNDSFPLKTDKWELSFGLTRSKAVVDEEYEETLNLANMSKKEYYFEFHGNPSHKYNLDIVPKAATLKPGTAIQVTFKLKMLCTTSVNDTLGISAMDVDDQNKETAKFTIIAESDLSLKLDHQELKPIMPPIGEGAFGMVFRGTYRGREVAIKKMKARNLTQEQEKEFNHEVGMMTQLRHATVVELIGAVYTEGEISIVTEFAEYGSLSKVWGKHDVSYQLKIKFLDDMAVSLAFLHKNEILHRDVKGENMLIYSLNPHSPVCGKLTDFGTCRNISERNLSAKELTVGIGTPTYMPPETLQNSTDYSYPVDVYAYGIVLYETYVERNGYSNDDRFNQPWMIPQFIIEGNRLDKPEGIPENYWELTTKCWSQNPEDRPTFADILKIIESWGEDIRYALNVTAEREGGAASDMSSSSASSIPSSAQQSETSEDRSSTTADSVSEALKKDEE